MKRKYNLSFIILDSLQIRYFMIFIAIVFNINVYSQLNADFNNGSLSVPKWLGDVSNFKINAEKQLQLNATIAGESYIYTKYKVPKDSIQIDMYFKLQFSPSNDNMGKIYLFTDHPTESLANGYYLKLGENGSLDAIQVFKLTNGISSIRGSGTMGAISADPADARFRIKVYRNGYWKMEVDYDGGQLLKDDLEFSDPGFVFQDSMFFGIQCKYTVTRIDKFFYDDISIKTIERDSIPPTVVNATVINETSLKVDFSEAVEKNSAETTSNYSVNNGLGSPNQVVYNALTPNMVTLVYSTIKIESGKEYTLSVTGVIDKSGNQKLSTKDFVFAVSPQKGDLALTEVLTDPYVGGEDFIELYNKSKKFLKLDGLIVRNGQKNESKAIPTNFILLPGKYVAITKNVDFLKSKYNPIPEAQFISGTLPSLNVDGANITIISLNNNVETVLDSFDYSQKFHFSLIDEKKGVSLERIRIDGESNNPNNWHSASQQTLFATPGYKNSNGLNTSTTETTGIFPDKKVITPNGDGTDDFLLLNYKMEKPGYLATIKIFDAEGFPILDLTNNYLLGTEGSIKWDGVDGEGKRMRMGMYIILSRVFHTDGDIKEFKNVVVVAGHF